MPPETTEFTLKPRSYQQGWDEIFGRSSKPDPEPPKPTVSSASTLSSEPGMVDAANIEWSTTRALSIRQPFAELIMLGRKVIEYRSRATRIRGRIAIYASLTFGQYESEIAEDEGLSTGDLPRGVLVGTVELYDCDEDEWYLRDPIRFTEPLAPTKKPQPVWFWPF